MQLAQSLVFKEKERQTELGFERRTYQSKVRQYALLAGIGLLLLVLVGLYRNNRIKQKANPGFGNAEEKSRRDVS